MQYIDIRILTKAKLNDTFPTMQFLVTGFSIEIETGEEF